jgi:site-specific DNA recombinase
MTRAVIYARYSSDNQRDASIEDQVRQCRARIDQEEWQRGEVYSDHAISGATTLRPGYQKMLEDARAGRFDVLVAEALDRLSRDQENIAALFKQLSFAGVRLITLSEGEIGELHVGLKGTMNALFLKDLAQKTRRGLEGRIRQGKSGGGRCFGYDIVHSVDHSGEPVHGERRINQIEAAIVRRIFEEFAKGRSPRAIAGALNKETISGPASKAWGPSTIYGNWRRGTGILNNELYIGRLVWNRQQFVKDPHTGRRVARLNPEAKWIVENVPHLRIIDDELWDLVKERQRASRSSVMTPDKGVRSERARRPRFCGIPRKNRQLARGPQCRGHPRRGSGIHSWAHRGNPARARKRQADHRVIRPACSSHQPRKPAPPCKAAPPFWWNEGASNAGCGGRI